MANMHGVIHYGLGLLTLIIASLLTSIYMATLGIAIVIWAASVNIADAISSK